MSVTEIGHVSRKFHVDPCPISDTFKRQAFHIILYIDLQLLTKFKFQRGITVIRTIPCCLRNKHVVLLKNRIDTRAGFP